MHCLFNVILKKWKACVCVCVYIVNINIHVNIYLENVLNGFYKIESTLGNGWVIVADLCIRIYLNFPASLMY